MSRHIWVNSKRLKSTIATEELDGVKLTVAISPYALPHFVVGRYDKTTGRFTIEFQYLDDEKASPKPRIVEGIEIREGVRTRKILSISLPINHRPLNKVAMIELRTKLAKAFRERLAGENDPFKPKSLDTMNQNVAEEILDEKNMNELTMDLVTT